MRMASAAGVMPSIRWARAIDPGRTRFSFPQVHWKGRESVKIKVIGMDRRLLLAQHRAMSAAFVDPYRPHSVPRFRAILHDRWLDFAQLRPDFCKVVTDTRVGQQLEGRSRRRRPSPANPCGVLHWASTRLTRRSRAVRQLVGKGCEVTPFRPDQPPFQAERRQPLIGIVRPQRQAELSPRREHAIGLGRPGWSDRRS
jgi:hypothetical protein